MSLMRQVGLLAAGCQPWNLDVCSASSKGERFAYCATLAVYIYELDQQFNEYKLISIMSEHKKTITSLCWHPSNSDILATAGADCRICIWNVTEQKTVAVLNNIKVVPTCIGWCPHETEVIAYIYGRGPLYTWNHFSASGGTVSKHLDSISFFSDICQFRWNMKKIGKIALGHADGSISVISPGNRPYKHYLRPDTVDDPDEEDPVTAIEWDPLSIDYLLVSNARHGVRMIDSNSMSVVMNFKLASLAARIHTLAWIPSAPGMFVTGDTQTGALRVWNVSKSSPIANIKLKKTGFHALTVISAIDQSTSNGHIQTSVSSTSAASAASSIATVNDFALPPAQILCTFLDGGVGLYDLGKRKWNFLREMGHVETIFDCKFKPEDADLLATASFDGTIKVWNVNTMTAVETSPGNEGIIYALSWAPGDLNCIAGATAKQGVFIWDISKKKIIKKFTEHGKNSVYNVSWNHKDSQRIASCGSDGCCVVRKVDGSTIKRYKHPGAVYGCDWSLNNRDMLATGCEDKNVRVYYLPASTDMPLKVFSGHTAKVFHVKWSPLREGVLCSGSDDGTIRVWDYTQDFCVLLLEGHTAPIRGLLWNPEIPYLVLSGSWDYTIRMWDARDGKCLDVIRDHGADVYGLTCHRHRPFTVASCSRDSTLRIWSVGQVVSPLQIGVLAQSPWSEIISQTLDEAMVVGSPPLLTGRTSRDIKVVIDKSLDNAHQTAIKLFSDFFMPPCGAKNLWDLVSVLCNEDESVLPASYSKGIMHSKHLVKYKASEAQEIETVKISRLGSGLSNSQDERLKDAASIHIKIGQIQRYCELMVELGQVYVDFKNKSERHIQFLMDSMYRNPRWDKALAIAPGVSMDYWKELIERHADQLVQEDDDDAIPYCVASGNTQQLVSFYTSRGQLHDALLVAQVACEAGFPLLLDRNANKLPDLKRNDHMLPKIQSDMAKQYQPLLHSTSNTLADWYYSKGQCVESACCHLSVGDVKFAMSKLVRGNELELAVSMGIVLQATKHPIMHRAIELITWKCEKLNKWRAALNLLNLIPKNVEYLLALCAKCQGTPAEINELHEKAGFPSLEECLQKAEELCEQEKFLDAMKYYLLSSSPELALDIGLNLARDAMVKQYWGLDDVLKIVQLLSCIRSDRLAQSRINKQRQELVALSTYIGALLAIRRQYTPIVYPLLKQTRHLLHRDKIELGVPSLQIQAETEAWLAFNQPANSLNKPTPEQTTVWERFRLRAGTQKDDLECGLDIATGSLLPSHTDVQQCYFTGERIKGTAYALEDGKSSISLNHALMWAKVNAFSPLGTGTRFNPF